jgi:anti-sigma B factor antagonist
VTLVSQDAGAALDFDAAYDETRRVLRVRVRGELDLATAPELTELVARLVADHRAAELDVSGLSFCDVAGLAAVEDAQARMDARGCALTVTGTAPLRLLLGVPGLFPTLRIAAA